MKEKTIAENTASHVCPICGGKKFVECVQDNYAALYPSNKIFSFKSHPLYHEICTNCGTVLRSYVKNPEKLIK